MNTQRRIALGIEYDGTQYFGWQSQESLPCVQTQLELAISRVANHPIEVTCAGRTDKGVHALEQVVHFDTTVVRDQKAWVMGVNTHLPDDIRVIWVADVTEAFHARFSATARRYHYVLYNNPVRSALLRHLVAWHYRPLNERWMHEAGQALVGEHDFNAYRAAECQALHAVREIKHLSVTRHQDFILVDVSANGFLHHMVRNIVGVLLQIGEGVQSLAWAAEVLESQDRTRAGVTASAQGLYLAQISYPQTFNLPKRKNNFLVDCLL